MLSPVGPGKFYGSSLPRPRYYTNVKLNDERVDQPLPVLDPLLSWADEAHWSVGGRSFDRLRLQGRIEGNVSKLRAEREKIADRKQQSAFVSADSSDFDEDSEAKSDAARKRAAASVSPPPAPIAVKRRRFVPLFDEDEIEEKGNAGAGNRLDWMQTIRNLGDDFDLAASESTVEEEIGRTDGSSSLIGSSPMQTRNQTSKSGRVVKVAEKVKGKNLKSVKGKLGGLRSVSPRSSIRSSPR